jgi:hypothetical protein
VKEAISPKAHRALRALRALVVGALEVVWTALVVLAPLFAAWGASSIARRTRTRCFARGSRCARDALRSEIGEYKLEIFAGPERYATHYDMGSLRVHSR